MPDSSATHVITPPKKMGVTTAFRRAFPDSRTDPITVPQVVAAPEKVAIPGYELQHELGRGGMGVVYAARQLKLDRVVALKLLLGGRFAGQDDRARFRREVEAVARLQHPNIVQVYDIGEHDGIVYAAFEYVEGETLAARLKVKSITN